jgi:hypothetical protein
MICRHSCVFSWPWLVSSSLEPDASEHGEPRVTQVTQSALEISYTEARGQLHQRWRWWQSLSRHVDDEGLGLGVI